MSGEMPACGEELGIGDGGRGCQRRESGGFHEGRVPRGVSRTSPGEKKIDIVTREKQDFETRPERKEPYDHVEPPIQYRRKYKCDQIHFPNLTLPDVFNP